MLSLRSHLLIGFLAGVMLVVGVAPAQTPSLTLFGVPTDARDSYGTAISTDGRVAAGYARTAEGGGSYRGFSWDSSAGFDYWGNSPGVPINTQGFAISANGSVIVGTQTPDFAGNHTRAFRYSSGTYENLAAPAGFNLISANGVSGDGEIVVGSMGSTSMALSGGWRWTRATGVQHIGTARPGDRAGGFTGISRDGLTAIGISGGSTGALFDAVTWSQVDGWRVLPVPAGTTPSGYDARPYGTNIDGSIVVGTVDPAGALARALLWRNAQVLDLGAFGSDWSMAATGTSDDGSVIVGGGFDAVARRDSAAIWFGGSGPINFQDYLSLSGVNVPSGWRLASCRGVSADGQTIVGVAQMGNLYQGFVATIPSPGTIAFAFALIGFSSMRRRRHVDENRNLVGNSPCVDHALSCCWRPSA